MTAPAGSDPSVIASVPVQAFGVKTRGGQGERSDAISNPAQLIWLSRALANHRCSDGVQWQEGFSQSSCKSVATAMAAKRMSRGSCARLPGAYLLVGRNVM